MIAKHMFVCSAFYIMLHTSGTTGTQYNTVRRPYGYTCERESDALVCRPASPVVPSRTVSTECIPYFVFYLCKRSASVCVWHLIGAITVSVRACACENKYIPHVFGEHSMRIFLIFRNAHMRQSMRGAVACVCLIFNCELHPDM